MTRSSPIVPHTTPNLAVCKLNAHNKRIPFDRQNLNMAEPVEVGEYSLLLGKLEHHPQTADTHNGRAAYPHGCEQLRNVLPSWPSHNLNLFPKTNQLAVDYSLANPDTLTKYKTAAQISHKVLETVTGMMFCSSKRSTAN